MLKQNINLFEDACEYVLLISNTEEDCQNRHCFISYYYINKCHYEFIFAVSIKKDVIAEPKKSLILQHQKQSAEQGYRDCGVLTVTF